MPGNRRVDNVLFVYFPSAAAIVVAAPAVQFLVFRDGKAMMRTSGHCRHQEVYAEEVLDDFRRRRHHPAPLRQLPVIARAPSIQPAPLQHGRVSHDCHTVPVPSGDLQYRFAPHLGNEHRLPAVVVVPQTQLAPRAVAPHPDPRTTPCQCVVRATADLLDRLQRFQVLRHREEVPFRLRDAVALGVANAQTSIGPVAPNIHMARLPCQNRGVIRPRRDLPHSGETIVDGNVRLMDQLPQSQLTRFSITPNKAVPASANGNIMRRSDLNL
mmetsp:Transcript_17287/g.29026  ORF Transcript_17287/g.29026 Transcript_17287/m.29026 type:complete len:269 (-) Transcript_17287:625-1431(-)